MRLQALAVIMLLVCNTAYASAPHYVNGSEGLDMGVMPEPGLYFRMYNLYYSANQVRDNSGNKINLDSFKYRTYLEVNRLIYASNIRILGARWSVDVSVPIVYTDFSVYNSRQIRLPDMHVYNLKISKQDNSFGLSDIVLNPAYLTWESDWYEFTTGFGVYIPTGRYNSNDPSSVGRGFWTFAPGLGVTVFPDKAKTWTLSIGGAYEFHTKQRQSKVTPGNHFHIDWGVGKRFLEVFELGVVGYDSWQVTSDQGGHAQKHKSSVHAIGPELNITFPKLKSQLTLRSMWEYKAKNNTKGNITAVNWTYSF